MLVRLRGLISLAVLAAMMGCGSGSENNSTSGGTPSALSADNSEAIAFDLSGRMSSTMTRVNGVMELTISGLGTNNPQTEVKWLGQAGDGASTAIADASAKSNASTTPLLGFLDVASIATTTMDAGGIRYIATRLKVRNAPSCGTPGSCAAYNTARNNVTFFAVLMADTINQTAVSRFRRFDGTDANPLLTAQLLPAHAIAQETLRVNRPLASLQVYTESEVPVAEPGVLSVFPYGFVVKNVNNSASRTLPANPAVNQYDGEVTFAFQIPLQPSPTDDPFKISMRFQTADDANTRVTQSTYERNFSGDQAAFSRALSLGSKDMVVLGGVVPSQTTIGNPICRVRIGGTNASPTAFLVDQIPSAPSAKAAPMNLNNVATNSDVSLGFCTNMNSPTASTLFVDGSMSGRRVVGGAYGGVLTGGGLTSRRNQLIWDITGQKPFFRGETVSFTATAGNTTTSSLAIQRFVGSFRVQGSTNSANGNFAARTNFPMGTEPRSVALGDLNGDGDLDVVTANSLSSDVSIRLGDGAGGLGPMTSYVVGSLPYSVALGDVDGDGDLDIVTADFGSNQLSILMGNGFGGFVVPAISIALPAGPTSVALGDINADGKLDFVTTLANADLVSVMFGNGSGGVTTTTSLTAVSEPTSVTLVDLNNDGTMDIVTANKDTDDGSVFLNIGSTGTVFHSTGEFAFGGLPVSLAAGDVNSDGLADIVVANQLSGNVSVLFGTIAGTLGPAVNYSVGSTPTSVVLGDVNGDGRLDIVASNFLSNSVSVLFGDSAGGFAAATDFDMGTNPISVALGDMDGDGKLDMVAAKLGANNVSVRLGL